MSLQDGNIDDDLLLETSTTAEGIKVHRVNARSWVYPRGVPERDYQLSIIQTALLNNTLVCLPTGLGKTLIAAVVMYNFCRWFPHGKVVFVAPTKPLVNQQVQACYEFMGIKRKSIVELTGTVKADARAELWSLPDKRIYFCTPQTFNNDVCKGICPFELVVCLVVDECHRATGKYDIVTAVKKMQQRHKKFRVVGLSATPGGKKEAIQEVITNLMISSIEFRAEEDADVAAYRHARQVDVQVVQPSREVELCREELLKVMRGIIHRLTSLQAYFGNVDVELCTRYMLQRAQSAYEKQTNVNSQAFVLFKQGMLLADLREQLDSYGIDVALTYLNNKTDPRTKEGSNRHIQSLQHNQNFAEFKRRLEELVKHGASHPKMAALLDVILQHFQAAGPDAAPAGRIIVFTNLRESVDAIVDLLNNHNPGVVARKFVGQGGGVKGSGAGMKQSEQKKVLADFRKGEFNTLVATCIGEEGLDIPQVDLILCFDASASPIRNIQRMGRTGRHKEGRVVYILAGGKEEDNYRRNLQATAQLQQELRRQAFQLYTPNPRMLPRHFNPRKLDVDCSGSTPMKEPEAGKRGGRKASGRGGTAAGRGNGRGKSRGGLATVSAATGDSSDAAGLLAEASVPSGLGYAAEAAARKAAGRASGAAKKPTKAKGKGGNADAPRTHASNDAAAKQAMGDEAAEVDMAPADHFADMEVDVPSPNGVDQEKHGGAHVDGQASADGMQQSGFSHALLFPESASVIR
ncbi:hypothetical protein WJX72_003494 [[Myrmecia] bisecta]|uniref:ATP-dependent DNA helicase n=1 Tax=[Myrmecia] bisecta TaxID=41462 RepID=A0AAW1Q9V7_9CHLO